MFVVWRRGLGGSAFGLAQGGFLVFSLLFLLGALARGPVSLSAISSIIRLECHWGDLFNEWLIFDLIALYKELFEVLPVLDICPLAPDPATWEPVSR